MKGRNANGSDCDEYDVIVVGAGPAGSVTACYAASNGLSVLLIDKRKKIGVPVQCGEFLPAAEELRDMLPDVNPGDVETLFEIPTRIISKYMESITLVSPSEREYEFPFRGFSIDRDKFDSYLASEAVKAGAVLRKGTTFEGVENGRIVTTSGFFKTKVLVGADGPFSRVGKTHGFPQPGPIYPAVTCQVKGDFGSSLKMYFGRLSPGGFAWIIPKKNGANVGLGIRPGSSRKPVTKLLLEFLEGMGKRTKTMNAGHVPSGGPISETVKGKVLLVGDAAGHIMATNGGGIPFALVCGRIAGEAVAKHLEQGAPLSEYDREWRKAVGGPLATCVRIKKKADTVFGSNILLNLSMRLLGLGRMERAIRCKPLFGK